METQFWVEDMNIGPPDLDLARFATGIASRYKWSEKQYVRPLCCRVNQNGSLHGSIPPPADEFMEMCLSINFGARVCLVVLWEY